MKPARSRTPLPVKLLVFSLLCPSAASFAMGGLVLTPYRVLLIIMAVPVAMRYTRTAKPIIPDFLMLGHALWVLLALTKVHGPGIGVESGGIYAIEILGPYFLVRTYIHSLAQYKALVRLMLVMIAILFPIAWIESVTGYRPLLQLWGMVTGKSIYIASSPRFGFDRAATSFDHPILYGIFCATMFGMSHFAGRVRLVGRNDLLIGLATIPSLSSGALATLMVQLSFVVWRHLTAAWRGRWWVYISLFAAGYLVIDTLSNRSGIRVLLHYLTFSAQTAYNRMIIFEFGIKDVYRNPVFGIGFYVWSKPEWMHSDSMDNFWLVTAVRYGVPAFLTLALAVVLLCAMNWRGTQGSRMHMPRLGWVISIIGLSIGGATVHFWNHAFVYFAMVIGLGGALADMACRANSQAGVRGLRSAARPSNAREASAGNGGRADGSQ